MNLRETFRFNFKRLRQRNKLSQKRVAEMFSISPQSISKWERGEGYPSIEYLPELAEVFHCNIDEFFLPLPDEEDDEHFTVSSLLNSLALMEECRDADFKEYTIEQFNALANLYQFEHSIFGFFTFDAEYLKKILECDDKSLKPLIEKMIEHEMIIAVTLRGRHEFVFSRMRYSTLFFQQLAYYNP